MAESLAESEVYQLLRQRGFGDSVVENFAKNKIDMDVLKDLNADDIKELGIIALGDRKRLQKLIDGIQPKKSPVAVSSLPWIDTDSSECTEY